GFGIFTVGRYADGGTTITRAVGQVDRRFVTRHQPLVAIGRRAAKRAERMSVLEQAANVIERHLAQTRVFVARKQWFAFLPQTLMGVHAAAIVAKERLGHDGRRLAMLATHIL